MIPLSGLGLRAAVGARSPVAREALPRLHQRVLAPDRAVADGFSAWREAFGVVYGDVALRREVLAEVRRAHPWVPDPADLLPLLYTLHTFQALALERAVATVAGDADPRVFLDVFAWVAEDAAAAQVGAALAGFGAPESDADLARESYHDLVPRALRHALGEYFTPDWLAELVLDRAGFVGKPGETVLDPTCGSGSFLMQAVRKKRAHIPDPGALADDVARTVVGMDLNPIAALMARANLRLALGADLPVAVHRCDAVLDAPKSLGRFDVVVGNPPWVSWPHLPADYRARVLEIWLSYGLFDKGGYEARTTHDDFSLAVTCVAADRFAKDGGTLALVLSQSAFQARKGGDGFRRLRLGRGEDAVPLQVIGVDDMVAIQPFPGVANRTAVAVLRRGHPTVFPVDYTTWEKAVAGALPGDATLEEALRRTTRRPGKAVPVDPADARSPWLVLPEALLEGARRLLGPSPYRGRKGVEPLGAKGVYLLHPPRIVGDRVAVLNDLGRGRLAAIAAKGELPGEIEPDLVFPTVSGRHLARWGLRGTGWMLVPHEARPGPHNAIPAATMQARFPRTLAWLAQWQPELLATRARNGKFYDAALDPFYALDNVGTYTFAPYKVAWREQSRGLDACVLTTWEGEPMRGKPLLADSKVLFCGLDDGAQAHFVCALLNSAPVRLVIEASTIATQRGADVLQRVRLPTWNARDADHEALSALSKAAHDVVAAHGDASDIERDVDRLANRILGS